MVSSPDWGGFLLAPPSGEVFRDWSKNDRGMFAQAATARK